VVAGGQDVGEAGQVADLFHRLRLVRELQQVEVGIGHHHILGLAADPAAHVHIAVGAAGARRVDAETDAGALLLAAAAAAAGHIEGHRDQVALGQRLHVATQLDHLAGDLVAQDQALGRRGASAHHVLVASANVGGDDFQNHAVLTFPVSQCQLRIING